MSHLSGKRVLVVEDEALIAATIIEWLGEMGCEIVGPAARVADGYALADTAPIDAAVLDVNVNSQRVFPLADALGRRGIALVFATGYGDGIGHEVAKAPIIEKPFTFEQLARALTVALDETVHVPQTVDVPGWQRTTGDGTGLPARTDA